MAHLEHTAVDVTGIVLSDPAGNRVPLAGPDGVQVVVLMRHRH